MKKLQILLIVGLLVAVGSAYRQLHEIESSSTSNPPSVTTLESAAPASATATAKGAGGKPAFAVGEFVALVKNEAVAMSQLNDHPEEVEKRLKDLAEKMQEADVPELQATALNTSLNGDQRFLSVYILGESSLPKAQESLETIATAPIPTMSEARLTNQEEIIRSQAVESLRQPESLKRVLAQVNNSFVVDRAQRSLLYREGKVSRAPEQQDQEALSKLIKKTAH
ncbi:MAG TPA: hypothetical protein VIG33_10875 [Pseudobdellovibrionaceae bacterium]|jgi:hypothetical protein